MEFTKSRVVTDVQVRDRTRGEAPEVSALVERAKSGNARAFDDLMRFYEHRIIALAMQLGLSRDDAMDACQDTFVKVFRYIHRFRSGHSFFKWLYRIAIHAAYDHLRRRRTPGVVSIEDLEPREEGFFRVGGPTVENQVETAELACKVLANLGCLSRRERIVFVLRDLQEMATEEIGTILRLSPVTVRRHSMMARQKLRDKVFPRQD